MFIAASPVCLPHTSVPILLNTIFLYHPHLTSHHSWPFSPLFFLLFFLLFLSFLLSSHLLSISSHLQSLLLFLLFLPPPTAPSPPSILFLAYALFRLPPIALATTSTTAYLLCVASAGHILASKEREGE